MKAIISHVRSNLVYQGRIADCLTIYNLHLPDNFRKIDNYITFPEQKTCMLDLMSFLDEANIMFGLFLHLSVDK